MTRKKTVLIVAIVSLVVVCIGVYVAVRSNNSSIDNQAETTGTDQANAIVLDDIAVEGIDTIKENFADFPELVYSELFSAGSNKSYVGRDTEAIPYFVAASQAATNEEQRDSADAAVYLSATKSNNEQLAQEYADKLGDKLTTPSVSGAGQQNE
jgi:flagellar basal body-associated protein FliL